MADWVVPVLVAVIGGPLVVLIQQFRKESSEQHGVLAGKIDKINDKNINISLIREKIKVFKAAFIV